MPVIFIRHIGANLAYVEPVGAVDPGFGVGGGGVDPGYGHPIFGGHPDQGLPGSGAHPGNRPPGSGNPAFPDNSLPGGPPPHVNPGEVLVLIRDQAGVWHYHAMAPGSPPPRPLPEPPTGPGSPNVPSQGLPPVPPPHASGQPVPPMPTPQRR